MGKEKYIKEVMELFGRSPVVKSRDIKMVVNKLGVKISYPHLLAHNLVKSGKVQKVLKGCYTCYDDPIVAVFCFKPAYIGLQDALSVHNLWEQESNTVIVTSMRARIGMRRIMDANVVVHRIKQKYMFGFEYTKYGDFFVPVSDIEKTLIDFIYFKEPLEKEVLNVMKRKIDKKKLGNYLKKYPRKFRKKFLSLTNFSI